MGNQTAHYLRTEELYKKIIDLYPSALLDVVGETHVRGILDAILTQGKIEARVAALHQHGHTLRQIVQDRSIEDWQKIVDSV